MREKTKKVYEAPSMKVYKIGRTLILAGSTNVQTEDPENDSYIWS